MNKPTQQLGRDLFQHDARNIHKYIENVISELGKEKISTDKIFTEAANAVFGLCSLFENVGLTFDDVFELANACQHAKGVGSYVAKRVELV
jgi:hypothetical protein